MSAEPPAVLDQMLAPFGGRGAGARLKVVAGVIVLAVALGMAVGSAASSKAAGIVTMLIVLLGVALVLAVRAAHQFRAQAAAVLDDREPLLSFGKPDVLGGVGVRDLHGRWIDDATFVVIPVINDPAGAQAREVHATVQVESLDGTSLTPELPARWRSPGHTGTSAEATIPANGRVHHIDTVVRFARGEESYVWNDDSRASADAVRGPALDERFRIDEDDFLVWTSLMGANVPRKNVAFRVQRTGSALKVVPLG